MANQTPGYQEELEWLQEGLENPLACEASGALYQLIRLSSLLEAGMAAASTELEELAELANAPDGNFRARDGIQQQLDRTSDLSEQMSALHTGLAIVMAALNACCGDQSTRTDIFEEQHRMPFHQALAELLRLHPTALQDVASRNAVLQADDDPRTHSVRDWLNRQLAGGQD